MNAAKITLEFVRSTSALSMIGIIAYGFFLPITIVQGLVYNPLLLISLLGLFGYLSTRIRSINETAKIYPLDNITKYKIELRKAV